jgi:hypothetical protein
MKKGDVDALFIIGGIILYIVVIILVGLHL